MHDQLTALIEVSLYLCDNVGKLDDSLQGRVYDFSFFDCYSPFYVLLIELYFD